MSLRLALASTGLLACAAILSAQGMATGTRKPRPAPKFGADLPPPQVSFEDVAESAGLKGVVVSGHPERKRFLLESTGSGVVVFDADNDGLMDIFVVNGTDFETSPQNGPKSYLYRNLGGLRFEDVASEAGITKSGWGQGACAGDFDNDGLTDLFVTYYGHSVLYRNEGKGKFRDATAAAGVIHSGTRWDTGCSFFDYDLDGKLDLVVAGYVDFHPGKVPEPGASPFCQWKGLAVMCGPRGLPPGRNHLYHNEGNGTFKDVSEPSGIGKASDCYGFTAGASDFDNDGLPDVYVACDSTPSLLYRNLGRGRFEEIGVASGAALNEDGQEQAGMGIAMADYDEDGWIDIAKTNFADDTPNLYRNSGDGTFMDEVYRAGLGIHTAYLGWGTALADVDNDGARDFFIATGHVYPEVDRANTGSGFRQPRLLYQNIGKGKFRDVSPLAGPAFEQQWSSRGLAVADLDNDGSLEIVINNMGARPSLLKNTAEQRRWLLVRCIGTKANRSAVGARVYVYLGQRRLSSEVQTGTSFLSQHDPRLHFGLGDAATYSRIEVEWPGGRRERFPGGKANQIVTLTEGSGVPATR